MQIIVSLNGLRAAVSRHKLNEMKELIFESLSKSVQKVIGRFKTGWSLGLTM